MAPTGEEITERLAALRAEYPRVPVDQTTAVVDPDTRERIESAEGALDVRVRVENGDGETLHVADDGGWSLPLVSLAAGTRVGEEAEETVKRRVADRTGVEPDLERLRQVTLTGYHCEEWAAEDGQAYRLIADYEASPAGGSPDEDAAWRSED